MVRKNLPSDLLPCGCTALFSEENVPDALCAEHALPTGRWGVLHLLEGRVWFVDLVSGQEHLFRAPDLVVIEPEKPHRLRLEGPLRFRIDFFQAAGPDAVDVTIFDEVRRSFDRCEASGDFAERFYAAFLKASPQIAPLFLNTDFKKQRKLLRATVYIMVTRDLNDPKMRQTIERIGKSHSRLTLAIKPELYEVWLDSLCQTVKSMDPEWTSALEGQWRQRMRPGIQLITSLY